MLKNENNYYNREFTLRRTTTHLINFLDSKASKKHKFNIITNKNNKAIKDLKQISKLKNVNLQKYFSFNCFQLNTMFSKIFFFSLKPLLFFISIIQMILILKKDTSDIVLLNCGGYGDFRSEMAGAIASKLLGKKNISTNSSLLFSTKNMENYTKDDR